MKAFSKSILRIATAMLLVVVVVGLSVWGVRSWSSYREERRNAPLETRREWPEINIEAMDNTKASLSTMWRKGLMSYHFKIKGVPKRSKGDMREHEWILEFIDANGFEVFTHTIRNMSRVMGAKGE